MTIQSHHDASFKRQYEFIAVQFGWGAPDQRTANGPGVILDALLNHPDVMHAHAQANVHANGQDHGLYSVSYVNGFHPDGPLPCHADKPFVDHDDRRKQVTRMIQMLSDQVYRALHAGKTPIVLGGDHSIAMGTWRGVRRFFRERACALFWFDAHMDANTIDTSASRAPHGMPVATLIGQGYPEWICPTPEDADFSMAIHPNHVYQFGVRSFDRGEETLLQQQGAHMMYGPDCTPDALTARLHDCVDMMPTPVMGISIDIDAFDPVRMPGTGMWESDGIDPDVVARFVIQMAHDPRCVALEIAEFNPDKDIDHRTRDQIVGMLVSMMQG